MRLFSDATTLPADSMLARALRLAEFGRGGTYPNPMVGSVVVRDGEIVGGGFHERAGGPHAEIVALTAAGEQARGATVYVTLEPCNHAGRTGPCTCALIEAGVARVVIGMADPNPDVSGGGALALRDAGIDVSFAEDPTPFEELNEAWLKRVRTGSPWVTVKVAVTLDGHPALAARVRSAISGDGGSEVTRRLRSAVDAIVVGGSTAAIDDPALTVRDAEGTLADRQPVRVVLGGGEPLSPQLRLLSDGAGPVIALLPEDAAGELPPHVGVVRYAACEGLAGALRALGGTGVTHVLAEAGPRLFTSLVEGALVDELVLVHAGGFGGKSAPGLFEGEPAVDPRILRRLFRAVEAGVAAEDAVTVWRPRDSG
jgi:diaminohydroxyphosphoribosylaminopyrimidine deaminase/5-amino-6-(5-phosphoribosylamino)uracil reductase